MAMQIYKYGEIVTFTTVNKGAGQLAEPYILAVIRLDEGCHVLARIENGNATMAENISSENAFTAGTASVHTPAASIPVASIPAIGQKVRYLHDDEYGKVFSLSLNS